METLGEKTVCESVYVPVSLASQESLNSPAAGLKYLDISNDLELLLSDDKNKIGKTTAVKIRSLVSLVMNNLIDLERLCHGLSTENSMLKNFNESLLLITKDFASAKSAVNAFDNHSLNVRNGFTNAEVIDTVGQSYADKISSSDSSRGAITESRSTMGVKSFSGGDIDRLRSVLPRRMEKTEPFLTKMEVPTMELKSLPDECDQGDIENSNRSTNQLPATSTLLPPYSSNMDHHFTGPDCKGYPIGDRGGIDSDNSSGRETRSNNIGVRHGNDSTWHALSGLYAQIIVVVAAILVFTEVLHGPIPLLFFHGYLFTYLVGGGIVCFLGVYISMLAEKCPKLLNRNDDDEIEKTSFSRPFMRNLLSSDISIYLRIGAVVFGIGTLISSGLEVASIFTMPDDCMDGLNMAQPVLRGLFNFLQMHFLFMNAKEIIQALGWFRHAGLMHLVATNVAIWIRLVLWESATDWLEALHLSHNSSDKTETFKPDIALHTLESDTKYHEPNHRVQLTTMCLWVIEPDGKTEDLIALQFCFKNSTIGEIWEKAMPYLYPFTIQYSLVAAAAIYIIWSNLQVQRSKLRQLTTVSVYGEDPSEKQLSCAGSTRGLFLGLLALVAGMITLILFFVMADKKDFNSNFVVASLRCGILGISCLAAIQGLVQIRSMKSKTKRESRLTEMLQRTGMLAVYIYGICNMIVGGISMGSSAQHLVLFLDGKLMVVQACLQSLFIHQVTKKRLGPSNMDEKPGRQVVIFLVFSNIVLWLLESFTTQNHISSQLQLKFYGNITWSLISRIVLPLVIFYRFHSAVALMEAWRKSYKIKKN